MEVKENAINSQKRKKTKKQWFYIWCLSTLGIYISLIFIKMTWPSESVGSIFITLSVTGFLLLIFGIFWFGIVPVSWKIKNFIIKTIAISKENRNRNKVRIALSIFAVVVSAIIFNMFLTTEARLKSQFKKHIISNSNDIYDIGFHSFKFSEDKKKLLIEWNVTDSSYYYKKKKLTKPRKLELKKDEYGRYASKYNGIVLE